MKWQRNKKYVIKELSEDGLLKDPKRRGFYYYEKWYGNRYETEEEAWEAVEREAGKPTKYSCRVSYVVITEFELERVEKD